MAGFTEVWSDHDKQELVHSLFQILKCIQNGDKIQGQISLRYSKGLVNNMYAIDAPAKAYLLSLFAEFHILLDANSGESDLFYEQFLRSMMHVYGDSHAIIGDCYNLISNSRASQGRFADAIMFGVRCLLNRVNTVGLMHELTAQAHFNLGLLYRAHGESDKSRKELQICRGIWSTLVGDQSLEVAAIDMSIGQTERVCTNYDRAYLSFTMAHRTRLMVLGRAHPTTIAALQCVQSVKKSSACEFVSSLELMDRMEEIGWMSVSPPPPRSVARIMQGILMQLFSPAAMNTSDRTGNVVILMAKLRNIIFGLVSEFDAVALHEVVQTMSRTWNCDTENAGETILRALTQSVSDEFIAQRRVNNERMSVRRQSLNKTKEMPAQMCAASVPAQQSITIATTHQHIASGDVPDPPLLSDHTLVHTNDAHNESSPNEAVVSLPAEECIPSLQLCEAITVSSPASIINEVDPIADTTNACLLARENVSSNIDTALPIDTLRLGGHRLILTKDTDGNRITVRRTTGRDVLDALRIKIFAAGIFPLLLLPKEEALLQSEPPPVLHRTVSVDVDNSTKPTNLSTTIEKENLEEICVIPQTGPKKRSIPIPPPLPTTWPPKVINGENVEVPGGDSGDVIASMLAGKLTGMRNPLLAGGALSSGIASLKRRSVQKTTAGPKLKQFHWDMISDVPLKGSMWEEKPPVEITVKDFFPDLVESFAPSLKKSAVKLGKGTGGGGGGVTAALLNRPKQATALDGQKSQNINIMLAKFGSKTKVENILEAICKLDASSFAVPTVLSMLEFIPQPEETAAIAALVAEHGIDKIGKAEAYLFNLSKVPRVELYLRSLLLILTMHDTREQTVAAADVIQQACNEIRGSARLRVILGAILVVGNALNEGSKKSGATGFRLTSLSKLVQTKSNDNETLLEYILGRLGRAMPDAVMLQDDFTCLEVAAHVSFPTLQADISKMEAGINTLSRLREEVQSRSNQKASGDDTDYDTVLDKIDKYIVESTAVSKEVAHRYDTASAVHKDICRFLGEEAMDPEAIYGQVHSFTSQVANAVNKLKL